jgi:hypothetical protein
VSELEHFFVLGSRFSWETLNRKVLGSDIICWRFFMLIRGSWRLRVRVMPAWGSSHAEYKSECPSNGLRCFNTRERISVDGSIQLRSRGDISKPASISHVPHAPPISSAQLDDLAKIIRGAKDCLVLTGKMKNCFKQIHSVKLILKS